MGQPDGHRYLPTARTWTDLVRSIGWEFGHDIGEWEAGYILWEHTGFPSFFQGNPIEDCERQLRTFFKDEANGVARCPACGYAKGLHRIHCPALYEGPNVKRTGDYSVPPARLVVNVRPL